MEGGREQNYWPGFVDALSNVVLTLVFVLVIFVFALVMASNKVEQRMQQVVEAQQKLNAQQAALQNPSNIPTPANGLNPSASPAAPGVSATDAQSAEDLKKQLEQAKAELQQLRDENAKMLAQLQPNGVSDASAISNQNNKEMEIDVQAKQSANTSHGAVKIKQDTNGIILTYPSAVAEMDDKSTAELGHVLDALKPKMLNHKITLRSIIGKEPFSAARRLAYFRAISTRNALIAKGESSSDITSLIIQPPTPEDGRVEIVIENK